MDLIRTLSSPEATALANTFQFLDTAMKYCFIPCKNLIKKIYSEYKKKKENERRKEVICKVLYYAAFFCFFLLPNKSE